MRVLHVPESHAEAWRDWLKAKPMVYHWTSGAMRMKAVNHKPMNHPKKNHTH